MFPSFIIKYRRDSEPPGRDHTCAIVNGGVQCWGSNYHGQLGDGTGVSSSLTDPTPVSVFGLESGATAISSGEYHTCAIVNGGLKCWGSNSDGQLGNGTLVNSFAPVDVNSLGTGVTAVAASSETTCAIGLNGQLFCWGYGEYGELGSTTTTTSSTPIGVYGLESGVTAIAAGPGHTCASVNGSVMCWGLNSYGQVGNGLSNVYDSQSIPSAVIGL